MDVTCLWDIEEAETTVLDETRITNDCKTYSSLYQLETSVRMSLQKVGWQPEPCSDSVVLCSSLDSVVVSAGNQLMLFNAHEHRLVATLNFESVIECHAFCNDGTVLVVCDYSGDVHVINAKTGKQLESRRLGTPSDIPVFKAIEFGGGASNRLAVLTTSGSLHVIDGLLTQEPKYSFVNIGCVPSCLSVMSNGDIIIADTDDTLNLWSSDQSTDNELNLVCSCIMPFGSAVRCLAVPGRSFVIVLGIGGELVLWNTDQFVAISVLNCPFVVDFSLIDRPGDGRHWCTAAATLHKTDASNCLRIYSLPHTELIFCVDLQPGALMFPSAVLNDSVYILEASARNASGGTDPVSSWCVKRLAETDPQTRLRRLLAKQRFSEAESFAEQFQLDLQLVYRESAVYLATKLSASDTDIDNDKEISCQLIRCLSRLDDTPYVVECCVKAAPPRIMTVSQLLKLASEMLATTKSLSAELHASLHIQLQETMRRLAAYQAAFGSEVYSREQWKQFRSVNMYEEMCRWLKAGRLDIASALCGRYADMLFPLIVSKLDSILAMIPEDVLMTELCAFLCQCVVPPSLASENLLIVDCLAAWVEKHVIDMEVMQRQEWPANAIQLCDVLKTSQCNAVFKQLTPKEYACQLVGLSVVQATVDEARQSHSALLRLRVLRSDLTQIAELHDKYRCRLSLAEFRSETVQTLVFRFLDRVVAVELIASTISDTVCAYAARNGLIVDILLASYVEELVHRCSTGSMPTSSVWESKAVEILGSISSSAQRLDSLLVILRAAHFPWSEDVANAVQTAVADNPNHAGLKEQLRLSALKQTLIGYDLRMFNFAETTYSKDLVYYILMQDRETAVSDALAVTEFYSNVTPTNVYLFRCNFLAENDRPGEIVTLLRAIVSQTLLDSVCELFVRHCSVVLSEPLQTYLLRHKYATAARYMRKLLPSLSADIQVDLSNHLSDLDAVDSINSDSDQFISFRDYCVPRKRRELGRQFLTECSSVDNNNLARSGSTMNAAQKKQDVRTCKASRCQLAGLCCVSGSELNLFDAAEAAKRGNIGTALELTERTVKKRTRNSIKTVEQLLRTLTAICDAVVRGSAVTEKELVATHQLSCWLVLMSPDSMVAKCLRVVRSTRLAIELHSQCSSESSFTAVTDTDDPYVQWTSDDYLSDNDCGGLVMDTKSALPLAYSFVAASLSGADTPCPLLVTDIQQAVSSSLGAISEQLSASDQTRLLLAYILEAAALTQGMVEVDDITTGVVTTLQQCIAQRRADYHLALTCVLSLSDTYAFDLLTKLGQSVGIQYKKALLVALVGLSLAQLTNNKSALLIAQSFVTEARWGYRFAKVRVSFRSCFRGSNNDKRSLIPMLAASEAVSVADILEYCAAFNLDVTQSLCMYLSCLLSSADADESTQPFEQVRQRAEEVCQYIDAGALVDTLEKIFDKTSPYDYERLEFILDRMLDCSRTSAELTRTSESIERDKKLLVCLKSYRRISPPTEDELLLGDAVQDRLPFHLLKAKKPRWRIITGELNADTVDLWVPMASILHLSADEIYTTAIRNIMQQHIKQLGARCPSGASGQWAEASIDREFKNAVNRLLGQVDSVELAAACACWVAHELPPSAEKVLACQCFISLQAKWIKSCSPDEKHRATELLDKHRVLCRQTAIEQVLHTSGLAEPGLLALAMSPARLMFRLYEHPSITDRMLHHSFLAASAMSSSASVAGVPDIHSVVDRIAAIGSIDACKVRIALLDKWLALRAGDDQLESADVTMTGEELSSGIGGLIDTGSNDGEDLDLLRAVHILQHPGTPLDETANSLIGCARHSASSAECQIRATRCLFMLADAVTVGRLSSQNDWPAYLASVIYTAELRRLRVLQVGWRGSFEMVDKTGLVRALCRCRDSTAGRVSACLGVDYKLSDDQLWLSICHRFTTSDLSLLLRPLPCHGRQITEAFGSLVSRWLREDTVNTANAVRITLLLGRCPTNVNSELARCCAKKLAEHGLLLCSLACSMMVESDDCTRPDVRSVVKSFSGNVDAELEAFTGTRHVLPALRQILTFIDANT